MKSYKLHTRWGRLSVGLAAPGTIWWYRARTRKGYQLRVDALFGLQRVYMRMIHMYLYDFHIGPLRVTWWPGLDEE